MEFIIRCRVRPGKREKKIYKDSCDMVHIDIEARAHGGKANEAVIAFLSDFCRIPKYDIWIQNGFTTQIKTIVIRSSLLSKETFLGLLDEA
jgi:uncharacterized protein YggU (UPF0235/DUF167 family)